jgi:hypothetical protein
MGEDTAAAALPALNATDDPSASGVTAASAASAPLPAAAAAAPRAPLVVSILANLPADTLRAVGAALAAAPAPPLLLAQGVDRLLAGPRRWLGRAAAQALHLQCSRCELCCASCCAGSISTSLRTAANTNA